MFGFLADTSVPTLAVIIVTEMKERTENEDEVVIEVEGVAAEIGAGVVTVETGVEGVVVETGVGGIAGGVGPVRGDVEGGQGVMDHQEEAEVAQGIGKGPPIRCALCYVGCIHVCMSMTSVFFCF